MRLHRISYSICICLYFPSKGLQNTVFFHLKKAKMQYDTFLKTFFFPFFVFLTVKVNRVQMVARTLVTVNLKTFQRISSWTTSTQDILGSFLCSWNGQKVLVTSLQRTWRVTSLFVSSILKAFSLKLYHFLWRWSKHTKISQCKESNFKPSCKKINTIHSKQIVHYWFCLLWENCSLPLKWTFFLRRQ